MSRKKLVEPQVPLKSNYHRNLSLEKLEDKDIEIVLSILNDSESDIETNISAIIPLDGETLNYIKLIFGKNFKRRAFIDTGSCANAVQKIYQLNLKTGR